VWRGVFFFFGPRVGLGTPPDRSSCGVCREEVGGLGSFRRALKEDMNSIDCGESPRMPLK
jgi:hypothetical protein